MRFGLAVRLVSIGASLLLVLWLLVLGLAYREGSLSRATSNPEPRQLAAIAELFAPAPAARQDRLLEAVRSPGLDVQIVPLSDVPEFDAQLLDSADLVPYQEVLGQRLLSARAQKLIGPDGIRWRFRAMPPLRFWIAAGENQALAIGVHLPFPVTPLGLPLGLGAGLLGTVFAFIALLLFHREIRPLARFAAAVDRIDLSTEPVPLPDTRSGTPEIAALVRAFDRLQNRLHTMTRSQMALIGGLQHDVRSFATRLRLRLENLPDASERDRATSDITDMISLLDNALLISRAGVGVLEEELLDLCELVSAEFTEFREAGMPVEAGEDFARKQAWIVGDRVALRRIILNVVDNAVKYGNFARATLEMDDERISVLVDDEGPGFSEEDRTLLLEPFVRAEPSRSRGTGGAGLGLSVARSLTEAHDGTIRLENTPGGGRVKVTLPLFKTS
ncbi:HAMP domain-containing sensor histidine kinase [Labrenzia sp. 011]|uniref:sensor histidine kinase n=1 Tax=Labrenzia sp. 011 TaxID=2171494 RepID=UPI000D50FE77|nr:HAMP domain-containing sensor histidine kinase [Labrenzia sp. 011]PVB59578.1 histidine kinase [Labrenzia sp. 011]